MRHQRGLVSDTRYACLLVEGGNRPQFPRSITRYKETRPRRLFRLSLPGRGPPPGARRRKYCADDIVQRLPLTHFTRHILHSLDFSTHSTRAAARSARADPGCPRLGYAELGYALRRDCRQTAPAHATLQTFAMPSTRARTAQRYAETFSTERPASFFRTRRRACSWGMQTGTRTQRYSTRSNATQQDATLGYAYATQRHSIRN